MRFIGFSKLRNGNYVVRPGNKIALPGQGTPMVIRPLRAVFTNHICDTDQQAKAENWSKEEKELVEQYMLDHPDRDRYADQSGFKLDDTPVVTAEAAAPAPDPVEEPPKIITPCIAIQTSTGQECGKPAEEGSLLCKECEELASGAPSTPAPANA